MLDEKAMRRDDFLAGSPVRLADSQDWILPGPQSMTAYLDADYEALLAAVREAEDEPELRRAELALAIALLSRNYNLRPADYWTLLDAPAGSPEAEALVAALHEVTLAHAERFRPAPLHRPSRPPAIARLRHPFSRLIRPS